MNRSARKHLPFVVKFSNKNNSLVSDLSGSPSGQNHVFNPLVAHQSSIDFSAPGQDERVLDCSDWYPTVGFAVVLGEVGHSADQPNVGGLHFPSPMSPITPVGARGAITPKPAGIKAGTSVRPTFRSNNMNTPVFLGLRDLFTNQGQTSLRDALMPVNNFEISGITDAGSIKYRHPASSNDWLLVLLSESDILGLENLGRDLMEGTVDSFAVIRFPEMFAWASQEEAKAFYSSVLPVVPERILFTCGEFDSIYVQLPSGHIAHIVPDVPGIYTGDYAFEKDLFKRIIESQQVAR